MVLIVEQILNGFQLGVMLFLMASGLTLILGIMNFVNLVHGSFYMIGAFLAAAFYGLTGSLWIAIPGAVIATGLVAASLEVSLFRVLYARGHLDQVLCTVGLIFFFNELVRVIWGSVPIKAEVPAFLQGSVELIPGLLYSKLRLGIIVAGLLVAVFLYWLIERTRVGMLIRAGASNRVMVGALGIRINRLYTIIFSLGAMLAALSGILAGPIYAVVAGMGDDVLILVLVVIIVGGVGSIHGALAGSLLVGIIDTFGRWLLPNTISDVGVYLLMAIVLAFRPNGLFRVGGVAE
ncbi:Branched-chain amino acid transport system permease protein OS=Castellaniella defragrans OX=75697 GN=HNR28_003466 PE=3 SV=1 [Castellaniella defragrans]